MINAVIVSNVCSTATSAKVTDFFEFCGEIVTVTPCPSPDGVEGTLAFEVVFATADSVETALLLSGSLLIDRAINVCAISVEGKHEQKEEEQKEAVAEEAATPTFDEPAAAMRSREAIVAMIAAGYSLGARALQFMQRVDSERHVSEQMRSKIELAVATAKQLDAERAGGAGARAVEHGLGVVAATMDKGQQLANTHLDPLAASALAKGQLYAERVLENPKVAAGWQSCKIWATATFDEARMRIKHEQERLLREREEAARAREAANFSLEPDEPVPPPVAPATSEQGTAVSPVAAAAA